MLGWLHATPENEKQPRCEVEKWPLPDVGAFSYLVDWFAELRLTYGYQEIKAWSDLTGTVLEPWEVKELIGLTSVYNRSVIEYRAKKYNLHPPYDGLADKSKITAKRLSNLFGD